MKKIAFIFLIYDRIILENVWFNFFKNVNKNLYNIYIHQKTPTQLKHFNEYVSKETEETCWGCIGNVKAFNLMLKQALLDPENEHFILVCGATAPVKSFNYVYKYFDKNYSYYIFAPEEQIFPRAEKAAKYMKRENIKKAEFWTVLNRKHAEVLVMNTLYLEWFKDVDCSDEHAHISYLYHKGFSHEIKNVRWMYVDWESVDPINSKTPRNHECKSDFDKNRIKEIERTKQYLFARKFVQPECEVHFHENKFNNQFNNFIKLIICILITFVIVTRK